MSGSSSSNLLGFRVYTDHKQSKPGDRLEYIGNNVHDNDLVKDLNYNLHKRMLEAMNQVL